MARTRSKPAAKPSEDEHSAVHTKALPDSENNPPKLFILPKNARKDARIVLLPDPVTNALARYFLCPSEGLYEFTRISAPKTTPRSFLLAPKVERKDNEREEENNNGISCSVAKGYISRSSELFVATPMDSLFFLLPILAPTSSKSQKRLFITFDDHIEPLGGQLKQILSGKETRVLFERRLNAVCETVEAGEENMFRLSNEKLAAVLVKKAKSMVSNGLPASMEERFVRQALQAPILSIKREHSGTVETQAQIMAETNENSQLSAQDSTFSQLSDATTSITIPCDTNAEEFIPSPTASHPSQEIEHLLRLRSALFYLSTSYIPTHLHTSLASTISTTKLIDFAPLDTYLAYLDSLRREAHALRSLSDNITRKRGFEDDEAAEARAEKKRKKEEEEAKKKRENRSLKQLKKVDTSGMKRMSSFFTKMPRK